MKRPLRNRLDNIIRDRMERFYPPYTPSHWDKLEEQLNEGLLDEEVPASTPETSFQDLDAALFEKMHAYQATYKAEHWPLMEKRLQQAFSWPQYILRYKSLELALVLLLFIGLWQWLPFPTPATVKAFNIPMEGIQTPATTTTGPAHYSADHKGQEQAYHSSLAQETPTSAADLNDAAPHIEPHEKPIETITAKDPSGRHSFGTETPVLLLPKLATPQVSSLSTTDNWAIPRLQPATNDWVALEAPLPISQRGILPLDYPEASLGKVRKPQDKQATKIRLGMFANGEFNHIVVPASEDRGLSESFERAAFGYGSGLSLDFDFGRVEIGTGLIYAARSYPVGLVYLEGSVSQGFEADELRTTELNIVNMPIHLRYDAVQQGKWRGYVLAGGAVQVAFQTNYFTADAPAQFNFQPAMPIPTVSDGGGGEEKAIDRIRQNGGGWFEGGSFEDNAYMTANLGFGVERFISERWSLFAQPVYQYSFHYFKKIDGLGPNEDRINSFSVLFGTRVRLR